MYDLKDKIEATEDFVNELITKSWQDAEALQQQAANINIDTALGKEVAKLLKDISTNYYVLIGCLESLLDSDSTGLEAFAEPQAADEPIVDNTESNEFVQEPELPTEDIPGTATEDTAFEPFEYFVDFDEPFGEPLSDKDLYGN